MIKDSYWRMLTDPYFNRKHPGGPQPCIRQSTYLVFFWKESGTLYNRPTFLLCHSWILAEGGKQVCKRLPSWESEPALLTHTIYSRVLVQITTRTKQHHLGTFLLIPDSHQPAEALTWGYTNVSLEAEEALPSHFHSSRMQLSTLEKLLAKL